MSLTLPRPSRQRQRGIMSIMAAIILIVAVIFGLSKTYDIIGNTSLSNVAQADSTAAFFLAESGVEIAKATIESANNVDNYTATTCTGLQGTSFTLGAGTVAITEATCTGESPCGECDVTVRGTVDAAERSIKIKISTVNSQGAEDCGSSPVLNLTTKEANHGVFTNLAYRAKNDGTMCGAGGGSNANIGSCIIELDGVFQSNCAPTTEGWNLAGTGLNNVSGLGIFTTLTGLATNTTYTIRQELVDNSNNSISRNYVQTGVMVSSPDPVNDPVRLIGAYGSTTGGNKTVGTSQTTGSLPSTWNCAENSGTAALSRAAGASTLLYGFSSWPANPNSQLNGVVIGTQPLRRQLAMTGNQGDYLYSQIWYSYNHAYYTTGATSGATNGANFSGRIGSTFAGSITGASNPRTLTLESAASLAPGSRITNSAGTTVYGTLGALSSGTWGAASSTYVINSTSEIATGTSLRAYDVLTVTAAPSSGVLTLGDAITNSGGGTTYGTLGALSSGTWGAVNSTYALASVGSPFVAAAASLESAGTTITIPNSTAIPSVGTAIAVASGTGAFGSATLTGSISGQVLTVTACGSGTPSIGDALFSSNIKPDTRITGPLTGTACDGTYSVSNEHSATSPATILSRAAVRGADSGETEPTATSFVASRAPSTRLSGTAQLCGGICMMLRTGTGFSLSNITTGDDWASGFACVAGVDPVSIKTLGVVSTRRTGWSEVVR